MAEATGFRLVNDLTQNGMFGRDFGRDLMGLKHMYASHHLSIKTIWLILSIRMSPDEWLNTDF